MDVQNFTEQYKIVYKDLYRFALCMLRQTHDAEDAVSEAVLAAYENLHKLRREEAFRSWIFQILANVCRGKLRNAKRQEEEQFQEPSAEEDVGLRMDVRRAFFILSEEEQFIVALSVFAGYSSREIGEMFRMNDNTVRSKRKRALEKMSVVLKE